MAPVEGRNVGSIVFDKLFGCYCWTKIFTTCLTKIDSKISSLFVRIDVVFIYLPKIGVS